MPTHYVRDSSYWHIPSPFLLVKMQNATHSLLLKFKQKPSNMTDLSQEIDPLQISFSNDKGFEPSTPSQGSPPTHKHPHLTISNPLQLFNSSPKNIPLKPSTTNKLSTPPSKTAPKVIPFTLYYQSSPRNSYLRQYQAKYSSSRKKVLSDSFSRDLIPKAPNQMYQSVMFDNRIGRSKKIQTIKRWQDIEVGSHLRQISRLTDLINRVDTHVGYYNRLYPLKRM